ncbi:DUF1643 domain-containing protein [Methanococcus aeolicus]|uniref:DUF1643 domain-containing protein n=1 Tax=Methanococcus aeolicus TaxID=42879 RepID=UPI0021C9245D|nr:DUF1643 domain-containing protein [Methanococcus aeolicus]UXM84506.1 DUF1643 domain-containing protein [Methanococcus aeolicus]
MKARIGRQVKHFENIAVDCITAIFSKNNLYRYTLQMQYKDKREQNNTITVILKNPSSANEKMADNTIRRVEGFVHCNFPDVKYLNILNIFAYRATDAKDVKNALINNGLNYIVGIENDKYIKSFVKESDYIIKAWGGNSGINKKAYNQRIEQVNDLIHNNVKKDVPIYRVDGNGKGSSLYPFHACFWSYTMGLEKY